MAFKVRANDGTTFSVGDINQIGSNSGPIYWLSGRSNSLDAYDIKQMMIKTSNVITWWMPSIFKAIKLPIGIAIKI